MLLEDMIKSNDNLVKESLEKANKYQRDYNSFVTICEDAKQEISNTSSYLNGIPCAIKDNISTKGILTTASSNILSNYVPVYDATIYKKLQKIVSSPSPNFRFLHH